MTIRTKSKTVIFSSTVRTRTWSDCCQAPHWSLWRAKKFRRLLWIFFLHTSLKTSAMHISICISLRNSTSLREEMQRRSMHPTEVLSRRSLTSKCSKQACGHLSWRKMRNRWPPNISFCTRREFTRSLRSALSQSLASRANLGSTSNWLHLQEDHQDRLRGETLLLSLGRRRREEKWNRKSPWQCCHYHGSKTHTRLN